MRLPEGVGPRFDLPKTVVAFPLPARRESSDLGTLAALPSFGDLIGAAVTIGFIALIFYMAYRIVVIPEGKWLKIQRKHKDWA